MKNYRIICYWPSETWAILEPIEFDNKPDWMEAHRCTSKGEDGYKEAIQWLKEKT